MASAGVGAVTLIAHDWGVMVAACVLAEAPQLVRRTVLCDIGAPARSDSLRVLCNRVFIFAYFATNATLYQLSRVPGLARVADALNALWVPRLCRYGDDDYGRPLSARGNYFYWNAAAIAGGRVGLAYRALHSPTRPLLFLHGTGIFHCHEWARKLRASTWEGSDAAYVCADHWFFRREPAKTAQVIADWLDATEATAEGGDTRGAAPAGSRPVRRRRSPSPSPRSRY